MTALTFPRRAIVVVGCAWLGAPSALLLLAPADSLQRVVASPIYVLFAAVQIILLACGVAAYRRRQGVATALMACAAGWTLAVALLLVLSPGGLVSLLMFLKPGGMASSIGSTGQLAAAVAGPVTYAVKGAVYLWILALVARIRAARDSTGAGSDAPARGHPLSRWEDRLIWTGILAAAIHVTLWPAIERTSLFAGIFHGQSSQMQIELTDAQRRALSPENLQAIKDLNEDLAYLGQRRPPPHVRVEDYRDVTWFKAQRYAILAHRQGGRVRQIDVLFYSGDLAKTVPEPTYFVDWPSEAASAGVGSAGLGRK